MGQFSSTQTHVTHQGFDPWPNGNKQASLNPKQHADRPNEKYLNVTIRRLKRHLVTQLFIHITNKLFDGNKKVIDNSYTIGRLVIQQDSRVFLSNV